MKPLYLIVPYPNLKLRGGILTYIKHLKKILEHEGKFVRVICEGVQDKAYRYAVGASREEMLRVAKEEHSLIINVYRDLPSSSAFDFNVELVTSGAPLVVHDSRIANPDVLKYADHIVCMGKNITNYYKKQGKQVTRIPMPYFPETFPLPTARKKVGISISRVDKQKNIEMITMINRISPVKIYISSLREMRYVNFVLNRKYPDWSRYYLGSHEDNNTTGAKICSQYSFSADLSLLPPVDMGRVQYVFLETMNAGVPLVIHKDWEKTGDEMVDGKNCIAVETPEDFVKRLPDIRTAEFKNEYGKILKRHKEDVAEIVIKAMER